MSVDCGRNLFKNTNVETIIPSVSVRNVQIPTLCWGLRDLFHAVSELCETCPRLTRGDGVRLYLIIVLRNMVMEAVRRWRRGCCDYCWGQCDMRG